MKSNISEIAKLGEQLANWFADNVSTFQTDDRVAHGKAILKGIAIVKELNQLKADGLAAVTALLNDEDVSTDSERIANLLQAFVFGQKLAAALHDELLDVDGETKVLRLVGVIVDKLDAIAPGRVALAGLLDDPDPVIQASAAALLIQMMPNRVVPILRAIEQNERGKGVSVRAGWALSSWEIESKQSRS
jgi:hypothetical protein